MAIVTHLKRKKSKWQHHHRQTDVLNPAALIRGRWKIALSAMLHHMEDSGIPHPALPTCYPGWVHSALQLQLLLSKQRDVLEQDTAVLLRFVFFLSHLGTVVHVVAS
jgi:hypothetical protein